MQQTSFIYNLVIADDCSTDGTREKIINFAKNRDDTSLILQKKNKGPNLNFVDLVTKPKTKYIAYLEGDDYWTDPYKLQKQVDYLETHAECSFCFTDCQVERNKTLQEVHPNFKKENQFTNIDFADQSGSIAQTSTWLVRREYIQNLPKWVMNSYTSDWCMQVYFAKFGKGGYIPIKTAVYRVHENGVWSKLNPFEGWRKNLEFYKTATKQFNELSSRSRLKKRINKTIIEALELANIEANKKELIFWLLKKLFFCPFKSVKQSFHSLHLLAILRN